jgi:hypothetical protein
MVRRETEGFLSLVIPQLRYHRINPDRRLSFRRAKRSRAHLISGEGQNGFQGGEGGHGPDAIFEAVRPAAKLVPGAATFCYLSAGKAIT